MQPLTSFLDPLSSAKPVKGLKGMVEAASAENGGKPDFSGLLSALAKPFKTAGGDTEGAETAEIVDASDTGEVLPQAGKSGIELPLMVKTGKTLPVILPVAGKTPQTDIAEDTGDTDADAKQAEALADDALLTFVAPILGLPEQGATSDKTAAAVEAEGENTVAAQPQGAAALQARLKLPAHDEKAPANPETETQLDVQAQAPVDADTTPAHQQTPAVQLRVANRGSDNAGTQQSNTDQASTQPTSASSATAQNEAGRDDADQSADAQSNNRRGDAQKKVTQPLRFAGAEQPRELQQVGTGFSAEPAQPALTASTQQATHASAVHASSATASVDARQDLSQIVDRLVAAREAAAPASASLSIDHRDFGELSLRIDQRHDGRLAVELSARDPDAHRAVAAAVAADRGQFSGSDQSGGNNAQQQHSQQARLATADRDAGAGNGSQNSNNAARQDQPRGRPAMQREGDTGNSSRQPRGGIFA